MVEKEGNVGVSFGEEDKGTEEEEEENGGEGKAIIGERGKRHWRSKVRKVSVCDLQMGGG